MSMSQPQSNPPPSPKYRLPEGLNAAQLQAVQQASRELAEQMKLRQWCIGSAITAGAGADGVVKLAAEMFEFIAAVPSESEPN